MDNYTEEKLKTASIGKLFFSLALPAIISQFVNLLYTIEDRMSVGPIPQTGTTALTALGVCAPILTFVFSFAQLVSSGAAPLASISLGKGEREKANKIQGAFLWKISMQFPHSIHFSESTTLFHPGSIRIA